MFMHGREKRPTDWLFVPSLVEMETLKCPGFPGKPVWVWKAPPMQLLAAPVAWQQNKRNNDNNDKKPKTMYFKECSNRQIQNM